MSLFVLFAPSGLFAQQPAPGPQPLLERVPPVAPPSVRKDEMVTQIVQLRYWEAARVVEHLRPLLAKTVTMSADERTNTIVFTDTPTNARRIAQILRLIDEGAMSSHGSTDVRSPQPVPDAATPPPASASGTPAAPLPSSNYNDVLRRMMERRAKELSK